MARPQSAWEKPPQPRAAETPVALGDPWGSRSKASFPVEVRTAKPLLGRSPSGTDGLLIAAILLSLMLHGLGIGTIVAANILDRWWGPEQKPDEPVMEIVDLAEFPSLAEQVKAMARIPGVNAASSQTAASVNEPEAEPPKDSRGQIVDLAKPAQPEKPRADAKYLSEFDRRADEETVAREQALTPGVVADEFKGLGDKPKEGTDRFAGDAKSQYAVIGPQHGENGQDGELNPESGKPVRQMLDKDPFGILAKKQPEPEPPRPAGAPGKPGGAIDQPGEGVEVAMAGAPNNDYLPNVKPGDKTQLNSKEFVFASFWHRLQNQVEPFWHKYVQSADPGQVQKRDYITRVSVILAPDGSLIAVDVTQASGVAAWDRAVVSAFKDAAPFLNPPKGLIERDGMIHLDDLGFIVSVGGGTHIYSYGDPRAGNLFPGLNEGGMGRRR